VQLRKPWILKDYFWNVYFTGKENQSDTRLLIIFVVCVLFSHHLILPLIVTSASAQFCSFYFYCFMLFVKYILFYQDCRNQCANLHEQNNEVSTAQ